VNVPSRQRPWFHANAWKSAFLPPGAGHALSPTMRIFTATLLAALLTGVSAAHADGYVSLGVGSEAALGGEMDDRFLSEGSGAGRLALGYRSRSVAIEAVAFGNGLGFINSGATSDADMTSMSLGLDLKYHLDLMLGLEGYGRAGLHKTWLSQGVQSEMAAYQGDGHVLGGGLQYAFDILPKVDAAVWADYSHQVFELEDAAGEPLTGSADVVTFGVSLGL
jgi:hypothetical protein